MGARKPTLAEQTAHLAETFPVDTKVRVKNENIIGTVEGYRRGASLNRLNEMALIVDVPGDKWVLYADQVLKYKEGKK